MIHIYKYKSYKNDARLNRYNFQSISTLFKKIHTSPFSLILESCICFVPALQRPISLTVQTRHIFLLENEIHFKFGLYVDHVPIDFSPVR